MAKQKEEPKEAALVAYDSKKLIALDEAAKEIKDLSVLKSETPFAAGLGMALALDKMRELLTPDVMKYIMKLQGTNLGFLTDKDKSGGYGVEVVRDVLIEAFAVGANMVGKEINIMSKGMYLCKNFFFRVLDEKLGADNWNFNHELPQIQTKKMRGANGTEYNEIQGATVKTAIWWKDKTGEHTQEITKAIKGDKHASADAYYGKADRKAGCWLLGQVTGERFSDGDVEDYETIDITASASVVENADVENDETLADANTVKYLHVLATDLSIKDLDCAGNAFMLLKGPRMTKIKARELYKELVTAIRKEGGKIPAMPDLSIKDKKEDDEKKPEPELSFDDQKKKDLIDRINSIGTDIHGPDWSPNDLAVDLYGKESLQVMTIGELTESLKEIKAESEATNV